MRRLVLVGCLFILASHAWAHRLDEYLQATRIAVATNRIDLSLELTPGVAVADQLLGVIDQDHDGQISKKESVAYTQRVFKDIKIRLNEKPLSLTATETSFPPLKEMKTGTGVIRIKAAVLVEQLSTGSHTVTLTNAHLPSISVYLVNAFVPKDPTIKITTQNRDELQKTYRLEFTVSPSRQWRR